MTAADLRRLAPDLPTARFGRPLHIYESAPSTNDLARRLAEDGAAEGTAVLALTQTRGRGRLGRSWASPPGGLYLSVVLRPELPPARWPLLALAVALGAAAGAEEASGIAVKLKWPNDLVTEEGKVGGVLLEAGPDHAVAGIGINAAPPAADLPPGAAALGVPLPPLVQAVLWHVERSVDLAYADPRRILAPWRARCVTLGRRIRIAGTEAVEGVAEDVDGDGALIVRTPAGVRRIVAGDVAIRDEE
ncbi:MAG: biotin--[acetyl-CoA-carboxylase] ligase [Armatimonadota bacterium]|nr:biotin--[acetyl-CoA-carboxylase] ligase [Armatimonadota bacterium]MDR7451618.1 biotin--[acetyl-CoA-carboxylase] ligase [Armatimonadota bacterium]MDR7467662.1 biotin--[acetyl-CoA-carboxylase] ligase [Armatimonadota bacterium]MDR7492587.1 biotin--[acetyl-CoA-carboxylase] ligase [Armatimonadota bacterium]MDR7499945.1 biotin--[acetyl-CoA-carboxylase] ligase [Armatimonadota bacterium]